jgi:Dimerisation domain
MRRRDNAADDLLNLASMRQKPDSTSHLSTAELDPSHIIEVGTGFWPSKTLLSAVELDLFSVLGAESMSGEQVGARLALHPRAIDDFLDALVALGFLERTGRAPTGAIATAPRRRRSSTNTAPPTLGDSSSCATPGSTGSGVN